jgi:hypothetical protein
MADVETPNNLAIPAKDISNSSTNRSAISERTRGILPRRLPIGSLSKDIFHPLRFSLTMISVLFSGSRALILYPNG